ncbi:MAG: cytochrome c-type biosis protein CcmB [Dehalococcoidales bacterium]|nr:cytochrome c-type biosis protein CcmB [Dehalococcoidales bacterium]
MSFWRKVIAITWKDALCEMRTKEVVPSVLVFTLLVIVIFNFAFEPGQGTTELIAPGILWVTFAFAGVLSLNRAFITEKEEGCMEGLMASPISREVIYVGKMLGSLLFMFIIEAIALPFFVFLFNVSVFSPQLIVVTILATIGFVAVGTLFAALAINTRAREMVLPILFLPIVIPVIISAVQGSALAIAGEPWSQLYPWLQILGAFDAIFLVVPFFIFAYVIEE